MRGFGVLLWLEWKRSQILVPILAGILFLALLAPLLFSEDELDIFGNLYGSRSVAMAAGVVLTFGTTLVSWARERRSGTFKLLLLSPVPPGGPVLARFVVPTVLVGSFCLALNAGTDALLRHFLGLKANLGLSLLGMFYVLGTYVLPSYAWLLVGFLFTQAYRPTGTLVPALTVFLAGSGAVGWLISELLMTVSGYLPKLALIQDFRLSPGRGLQWEVVIHRVSQEPLWAMLALTLLFLVIAGFLWKEVEV